MTNLIVTFVLANLGTQEIKGFAITLGIGVVATLFSAGREPAADRVDGRCREDQEAPDAADGDPGDRALEPRIDWISMRFVFIVLSAMGVGTGLFMVAWQGQEMLDTEFRGGTQVDFELRPANESEAASGVGVNARGRLTLTRAEVEERVRGLSEGLSETDPLRPLRNASVIPVNPEANGVTSDRFQIKTYATNADAVIGAIVAAFDDVVESRPALSFRGRDAIGRGAPVFPVLGQRLGDVIQPPGVSRGGGRVFRRRGGGARGPPDRTPGLDRDPPSDAGQPGAPPGSDAFQAGLFDDAESEPRGPDPRVARPGRSSRW